MSILVHLKAIVSLFILALKDSSLPLLYQLVVERTNIFVIQYSKSFNRNSIIGIAKHIEEENLLIMYLNCYCIVRCMKKKTYSYGC